MGNQFELAVVHPLVLLSVVDHYHRVAKDTRKRVLGVLVGEVSKGRIDITNSFAGQCFCYTLMVRYAETVDNFCLITYRRDVSIAVYNAY